MIQERMRMGRLLLYLVASLILSSGTVCASALNCFLLQRSPRPYIRTTKAVEGMSNLIEDTESRMQQFAPAPNVRLTSLSPQTARDDAPSPLSTILLQIGWYDSPRKADSQDEITRAPNFESSTEVFHIVDVVSDRTAVVRREKKDAPLRFGASVVFPVRRYWRDHFARTPPGVLTVMTAEESSRHPLVREMAILSFLAPYGIAPKPIFVSPASFAGVSVTGAPLKTRFIVTRKPGRSIAELISMEGTIKVDKALRLIRKVVDATEAIHRLGIAHGSLNVSNVFLKESNNAAEGVLLTSFGFATIDARGLHQIPTLKDMRAIYELLAHMNGYFNRIPDQCHQEIGAFGKFACKLHRLTTLVTIVDEIDYKEIKRVISKALEALGVSVSV